MLSVIAVVAAAVATTGCEDTGIGAGDLANRSFIAAANDIDGIDLADGTVFTFNFSLDALAATAGCNVIRAEVDTVDDVLRAENVVRSTIICRDDVAAQEAWLEAFIADDPIIDAEDGSLTLTGPLGAVTATDVDD